MELDGGDSVLRRLPMESYTARLVHRQGSPRSHSESPTGVCELETAEVEDDGGYSTCSESWETSWSDTNERKVKDISLHYLYLPRTLTLLCVTILILVYIAFLRDEHQQTSGNVAAGLAGVCFFFLTLGLLIFPNGPFTRPHPILWRLVFGLSVLYLLLMEFILFLNKSDVFALLHYVDPRLKVAQADSHTMVYTRICELTSDNIWSHLDVFIPCHIVGWMLKAFLIRHTGMLWAISIMWELTEVFFAHLLPNFGECWWDTLLLDMLVCNGLGIHIGMYLVRRFEMKHFHWESIKDIKGVRGKIKRAVLQLTPERCSPTHWLDPAGRQMRTVAIFFLILVFQINELNCFLLKHVFYIPTSHYLNLVRVVIVCLTAAPSIRQYYVYITDQTCSRMGTQVWVFLVITATELLVSVKFGMSILPRPAFLFIVGWLLVIATISIASTLLITMQHPWWGWRRRRRQRRASEQQHEGTSQLKTRRGVIDIKQ